MDITNYCSNVRAELSEWKSRIANELDKIDKMPSIDKYKMLPVIEDFHIINIELGERIESLKHECELAWQPGRKTEHSSGHHGVDADQAEHVVGGGNLGG